MLNIDDIKFNQHGLVPAILVDDDTGEVLMMGYMNRESLSISLEKKLACFWSRSRRELWLKGDTSGNYQHIKRIVADCDRDTLLVYVKPDGPACHLGNKSCFVDELMAEGADPSGGTNTPSHQPVGDATPSPCPAGLNAEGTNTHLLQTAGPATSSLQTAGPAPAPQSVGPATTNTPSIPETTREQFTLCGLMELIKGRKVQKVEGSYTTYLFEKGLDKILKKIGEESSEVIIAAKNDRKETIYEISDLVYHLMVLMAETGIEIKDIIKELASRHVIDKKVKQEKMTS